MVDHIRALLVSLLAAFVLGVISAAVLEAESPASSNTASVMVVLTVDGTINPAVVDYLRDGLREAAERGAELMVVELDTPGGLLTSTQDIVKLLLNSSVPVAVYVSPSGATAASAGVFITLAANIAAMADGTSIGAAHPVVIGPQGRSPFAPGKGGEKEAEHESKDGGGREAEQIMGEKIENFAASFMKGIAEKRKRNVEWALEAVRKSASITAREALEKGVVDLVVPDLATLLERVDGKEVEVDGRTVQLRTRGALVERLEMNTKQKLVDLLSNPNIAFLLLSLGSLGLTMEVLKPGMVFPGVFGAICFITGCVSLQILPFNYAGLALLILALALFVAEIYVTSYGLLTLGGLVSFILGGLLLFRTPEADLRVGWDMLLSSAAAVGLFFAFVAYFLFRAQRLEPATGLESLVGQRGSAITDIAGTGKVFVSGEYWDAVSGDTINEGDEVVVVGMEHGMRLRVRKAE